MSHPLLPPPSLLFDLPQVVSFDLRRRQPLQSFAFTFPESSQWAARKGKDENGDPNHRKGSLLKSWKQRSTTRIRPPSDTIKLADRLYYLLQPPLESLLRNSDLSFCFEPFPYQYAGIAFMYSRHAAILADEMGLGKTMQAITAIRLLLRSGELRNVLLICPKPLVSNWRREFEMWAPEIPITIVEGKGAKRRWQWKNNDTVKIANYELLLRDWHSLGDEAPSFDLVVLDEAQRIKNRSSSTSQIVRQIPRGRSWALTGTPIENSVDDLLGIFDFLAPGYLSSAMTPRRIARAIGDYLLRRTKEDVLTDLPPKLYRDANLDLTPEQRETYQQAEEEGIVRLNELGDSLMVQHVFTLVLRLKQICNFDPATGASVKFDRLMADMEEVAASGKKAIIFSQWVETLLILKRRLKQFGPVEYHGRVPMRKREAVIEKFKNDDDSHVILMSYGAGSVGLNLQFCEYVFLFDRWWNPAVEDQAINRAHRIGVVGPVTVTRLMTQQTIEERIDQILQEKRALFSSILSEASCPTSLGLSQKEIFGLFKLRMPEKSEKRSA